MLVVAGLPLAVVLLGAVVLPVTVVLLAAAVLPAAAVLLVAVVLLAAVDLPPTALPADTGSLTGAAAALRPVSARRGWQET